MQWIPEPVNKRLNIPEFYSFFEEFCPRGFSFPGETHNFWECVYVLKGSIIASADERVYNLQKNEMIFHKPMEFHKLYTENPDGAYLLIFSFSMEGEIASFFEDKVFSLSVRQKEIASSLLDYIRGSSKITLKPGEIMTQQYLLPFRYSDNYSQTLQSYVYQLLLSLSDADNVISVESGYDASIFKTAVNYMNENLTTQLKISEIASHCNISESGLKRIFEKYAGIGVHKYFLMLKIKAAVNMLNDGATVTLVAETLGFSSQGYFSRVFKRETGKLPSKM